MLQILHKMSPQQMEKLAPIAGEPSVHLCMLVQRHTASVTRGVPVSCSYLDHLFLLLIADRHLVSVRGLVGVAVYSFPYHFNRPL